MPITKAKRRAITTEPAEHPGIIADAIRHLRSARALLRQVGSKAAADYVARTLKSAEGAKRHAERMDYSTMHGVDGEVVQ